MDEESAITFDHSYLYLEGEKFFPLIREQVVDDEMSEATNGILIVVKSEEEQDWDELYQQAKEAVDRGKWILWQLEFFGGCQPIFLEDSSQFFSLGLTIEAFSDTLWKPFEERTIGVSLFRGDIDFSRYFLWTEQHEKHYQEKMEEYPLLAGRGFLLRRLFAADVFVDYLHRLASFLPASVSVFCLLDVSSVESSAELALLLSKERFPHMLLALKRSKMPLGHLNWEEGACLGGWVGRDAPYFAAVPEVKIAVCLPPLGRIGVKQLASLEEIFLAFLRFGVTFRVVEEERLHETWDGIDDLVVLSDSVSVQGLRKIRGFLASGGRIVSVGASLETEHEISFVEFTSSLTEAEAFF